MPGMYADGEYDLAGFTVGVVDNDKLIDGSSITVGDKVIGIGSSGLHSNGYSLARKVLLERMALALDTKVEGLSQTLGAELLTPTKIYVKTILNLLRDFQVKGMAHITGGGLTENIPRILPKHCLTEIDKSSWPKPTIFELIREGGNIDELEMYRTFNYGIGMALIVTADDAEEVLLRLSGLGETAYLIGEVAPCKGDDCPQVVLG
jgi:phosphoribosylformylglycinamidine cyclo-ligase